MFFSLGQKLGKKITISVQSNSLIKDLQKISIKPKKKHKKKKNGNKNERNTFLSIQNTKWGKKKVYFQIIDQKHCIEVRSNQLLFTVLEDSVISNTVIMAPTVTVVIQSTFCLLSPWIVSYLIQLRNFPQHPIHLKKFSRHRIHFLWNKYFVVWQSQNIDFVKSWLLQTSRLSVLNQSHQSGQSSQARKSQVKFPASTTQMKWTLFSLTDPTIVMVKIRTMSSR